MLLLVEGERTKVATCQITRAEKVNEFLCKLCATNLFLISRPALKNRQVYMLGFTKQNAGIG